MEAWTNNSTGVDESPPEGAPSADPAADQITPPPEPVALAASNVAATPLPEEAVPTPQPLTMISGEIEAPTPAVPLVTIIPAPEPVLVAQVARTTAPVAAVVAAAPARAMGHGGGDDSTFEDQIINNWMKQGDRMADPRPVEDLDLLDLAEPTDPVAHELLDSTKSLARPPARAARVGRWISVGALGVAMAFGLYWAAQEPRPGAAAAAAVPTVASVADLAPVLAPTTQATAPTPAPATPIAAAETPSSAANAGHGRHNKHHRAPAARVHRRHGR
jgi:hypothetical protein